MHALVCVLLPSVCFLCSREGVCDAGVGVLVCLWVRGLRTTNQVLQTVLLFQKHLRDQFFGPKFWNNHRQAWIRMHPKSVPTLAMPGHLLRGPQHHFVCDDFFTPLPVPLSRRSQRFTHEA